MTRRPSRRYSKIVMRGPVWPDRLFVKLRYTTGIQPYVLPNSTGLTTFQYRGNGLYDPDVSLGGHQPYGFDQYMAMYDNWIVYASKCTTTVWALNTNTLEHALFPGDANAVTNLTDEYLQEVPRMKYHVIGPSRYAGTGDEVTIAQPSKSTLKYFWSTRKQYANDGDQEQYWGTAATDPTKQWYWYAIYRTPDGASQSIRYITHVKYYVMFFNRYDPGNS